MTENSFRHISTKLHGAELVVSVNHALLRDSETCYTIRDEIIAAIDSAGAKNVVLDLKSIVFVGSVGFLAFLGARRRLSDGRVILSSMPENVREMFRLCSLVSSDPSSPGPFEEAMSVESALAALSSSAV